MQPQDTQYPIVSEEEKREQERALVREAIMKKYTAAQDDTEVRQARNDAASQNKISGIFEGLEGIGRSAAVSRGGARTDSSFYEGQRAAAAGRVKDAQAAQKGRVDAVTGELAMTRDLNQEDRAAASAGYEKGRFGFDEENAARAGRDETRDIEAIKRGITVSDRDYQRQLVQDAIKKSQDEKAYGLDGRKLDQADRGLDIQQQTANQAGAKTKSGAPMTAMQAKKKGLADIGMLANDQYVAAVKKGGDSGEFSPTSYGDWMDNSEIAPNAWRNDSAIEAKAAAASWIDSFLRDESGAAVPAPEIPKYYKIYFPQAGDPQQVVDNKAVLRKAKMDNAKTAGGGEEAPATYPRTVTNSQTGKQVVVYDEGEYQEAQSDGFN